MTDMPFLTDEHRIFRDQLRRFVDEEVRPHADTWEAAGQTPREVMRRMGELGFLGIRYPEEYGGTAADYWFTVVFNEEMPLCRASGVHLGLMVQSDMATPALADIEDAQYGAMVTVLAQMRQEEFDALAAELKAFFDTNPVPPLFDDVKPLLDDLQQAGWRLREPALDVAEIGVGHHDVLVAPGHADLGLEDGGPRVGSHLGAGPDRLRGRGMPGDRRGPAGRPAPRECRRRGARGPGPGPGRGALRYDAERNHYLGVYGVQAAQLHDDQEQAQHARAAGDTQVLPSRAEAHRSQGDTLTGIHV